MKFSWVSPLLLALLAVGPRAVSAEDNPLAAVLSLIDGLAAKITKDGEVEAKQYEEYVEWCRGASRQYGFEIEEATKKQEKLEAAIAAAASDIEASGAKIEDLAASISVDEADLKSATAIRQKEAADFKAADAELADNIDALTRAIAILEREMAKNPAALAQLDTSSVSKLVQSIGAVVDAAAFSSADKQKLLSLVQDKSSDDDMGAPAAAVYKTHSTNIFDVLEDLKEKAEEELANLRKAEATAEHNYQMLKQSLEDQIAADTKTMNEEKASKAATEEAKATAEGDLAATVKDLAAAKKALASANSNCMTVAADHEKTVAARTEELAVIAQAKKILVDTTSGAVSQTYSMLQVGSQLRTRADLAKAEVVTLVQRLAKDQHSAALAQLASRIAAVVRYGAGAGEDPFVKVRGLITDMINKLEAEAEADATEKAWCDEQIAVTEAKKGELEDEIATLTAKVDKAAASSAAKKAEVKETQAELAKLAKLQAEMDKMRADQNAAFTQAKADLELGLEGVRKALSVLRGYYGGAASMLQQPAKPEMHEKAGGAGGSIIGILEVCESDFAANLAKEETQEADASAEYDKTTQENKVTRATKEQDVKYLTQEFKALDARIAELTADRETANTELSAVLDYYEKVKDRCIAKPEKYEERKRRRDAEIKGLKEALAILENETAFVQRRSLRVRKQ